MGSFVEFINDCGKIFIDSTGSMLIQSSLLIAILFGLDLLLRRRIRAVFRYCLWMLVLIKLVLPGNLSMPFSMGYWLTNAFDRVEGSLPYVATLIEAGIESSSESTEIAFDNPGRHVRPTTKDADTASMTKQLQSSYSAEAPAANANFRASAAKTDTRKDNTVLPLSEQADLVDNRALGLTWQGVLWGLWLVVCMTTGLLVLQRTLLMKRVVRGALPANKRLIELFESCRKRMLIGRDVGLRVSEIIPTPAVYGFFRPIVLIPKKMLSHDLGTSELEAIFIHELMHIQRCDLWVKLLQTILQVVYFYNPLLWLANATIRRVRELAVDEAVLVILGKSTSEVYPRTLLKVAGWAIDQPKYGLRLIGVMESNDLLKERINIMLQKPIPHSKKVGIIGLGILFILGVFLLPMARAEIEKAPAELTQSKTEIAEIKVETAKDIDEIKAMKAQIESLQLAIQMKLDELHEKQAELELLREALNVKIKGRGGSATTPDATEHVLAAVKPSDVGLSSAPPRGSQPTGGRVPAAFSMPRKPSATPSDAGPSPGQPLNKKPRGSMMMGALTMPPRPGVGTSATSSSSARPRGSQPRVPAMAALSMPPGAGVGQGSMLSEGALPDDISDEVRKELLRILPGLLREMLPKLLKEAQSKAVEHPRLIEKSAVNPGSPTLRVR